MYRLRSRPFAKHQQEAVAWMYSRESGAVLLPMGTGKSYITLAYLSLVDGPAVIVAPLSVLGSWEREIQRHTTATYSVAWGSPTERMAALHADVDIVLINYDYFSRKSADLKVFDRFEAMILDESTRIKNASANRTKNVIRASANIQKRFILTGTPITRSLADVYSQWLFMDHGKTFGSNHYKFMSKYFVPAVYGGQRRGWNLSRDGASKIAAAIKNDYFYRSKEDCVDLPPKVYEERTYVLPPETLKVYNEILDTWIAETEQGRRILNNPLSRDTLLRQVCSGYVGDGMGEITLELPSTKYDVLRDVVEEVGPNEQMVIWFWFRYEAVRIAQALRDYEEDIGIVHGGVDRDDRDSILHNVERGSTRIVLAQLQTCAYGINAFAKVPYSIYVGHSYDYDIRAQSEERTSRIGSTHACTYVDIYGDKTIEAAILQNLEKKKGLAPSVFKNELRIILEEWRG